MRDEVIARTLTAVDLGPDLGPAVAEWLARRPRRRAGRPPDRRHHLRRAAVRERRAERAGPGARRLRAGARCPTTCSRATRRRGSTTASRSTRWPSPRGGGRASTTTPSTGTTRCSRRIARSGRDGLGGPAAARGRRRTRHRQRLRAGRHGGTDPPGGRRAARAAAVRGRIRDVRDRRRHAGPALGHAPRHGDDDGRPRRVHDLPAGPPGADRLHPPARRAGHARGRPLRRDRPRARRAARCACSRPAATSTRPSGSSGTTATTSSPSRPASCSPTSATSTPTRGCAAPASRSSRSPARSSAAAVAARAACPARSRGMTYDHRQHPPRDAAHRGLARAAAVLAGRSGTRRAAPGALSPREVGRLDQVP